MTTAQLRAAGWSVLVQKMGAAGALRFMMDSERGTGDYTAERAARLPEMDVDALVREARVNRTRDNGGKSPNRRRSPKT